MTSPPGLSVFFPAYNDAGTIASLVMTALMTAETLTSDFEVIVINDGSADRTAEILDELARLYPRLRVVHHVRNRGYGGALRSGFATASKDWIFYTDGDGQYDPAEMTRAVGAQAATTSTWSTATRSAAPIRSTASSSAASTTTPSSCCSGCGCATSTATSGCCGGRCSSASTSRRTAASSAWR